MSGVTKDEIITFYKKHLVDHKYNVQEQGDNIRISIYDNSIILEFKPTDDDKKYNLTPSYYLTDDTYKLYTIYKCNLSLLMIEEKTLDFDYFIVDKNHINTNKNTLPDTFKTETNYLNLYIKFIEFIDIILATELIAEELKATELAKKLKATELKATELAKELKAEELKVKELETKKLKATELEATKLVKKLKTMKLKAINDELDLVKRLNELKNTVLDKATYEIHNAVITTYNKEYREWLKDRSKDKPVECKILTFINICRGMFLEMDPIKCADDLRELYNYFTEFSKQELYVLPRNSFYNGEFTKIDNNILKPSTESKKPIGRLPPTRLYADN